MASESGVLPIPDSKIVKKWRLQPGKMFLIDMDQGPHHRRQELKQSLAAAKPYAEWISRINIKLLAQDAVPSDRAPECNAGMLDRQQAFGFTQETSSSSSSRWARPARKPPVDGQRFAAGGAVVARKPLYNYFRQLFAQVTNPPIDPIREQR